MKKDKPGYFVTYRHFKRDSGGATAACVVHPLGDGTFDIVAGFAFCNPSDVFSRKEGRNHARDRLMTHPIILKNVTRIASAIITYLKSIINSLLLEQAFEELGIAEYKHANPDKQGTFDAWFVQFVSEL